MAGLGPRFSPEVNARIYEAHDLAGRRGDTHSDISHLLVALLTPETSQAVEELRRSGSSVEEMRSLARAALPPTPRHSGHAAPRWGNDEAVQVTSGFMAILDRANELAVAAGDSEVDELHLLKALTEHDDPVTDRVLGKVGLEPVEETVPSQSRTLRKLSQYGRILTDEAAAGLLDPVIGRSKELQRLTHILGRRRKNNPVLLGEPGVGKTAIVEGLAQAIVDGRVPSYLAGRQIFALDVGSLVAGTKYRGEFESRIQELLDSIRSAEGRIILFVDEVHLIARAGGAEGAIDAAGFLKPMMARGELRLIGSTTSIDYEKHVLGDGALERRFQPIHVREPTPAEALEMVRGLRSRYEHYHKLDISDSALVAAVEASHTGVPQRNLPDKAIDLIDEASSRKRAIAEADQEGHEPRRLEVSADDIIAVLDDWVGGTEQPDPADDGADNFLPERPRS